MSDLRCPECGKAGKYERLSVDDTVFSCSDCCYVVHGKIYFFPDLLELVKEYREEIFVNHVCLCAELETKQKIGDLDPDKEEEIKGYVKKEHEKLTQIDQLLKQIEGE